MSEARPLNIELAPFEIFSLWVILGISVLALAVAVYLVRQVLAQHEGTEKMREIARAIQIGAKAYLNRQFRTVAIFMAILTIVLFFALPVPEDAAHGELSIRLGRSLAFILGAAFSAVTGYTGMWLAVRANVRTAAKARLGLNAALRVAFGGRPRFSSRCDFSSSNAIPTSGRKRKSSKRTEERRSFLNSRVSFEPGAA